MIAYEIIYSNCKGCRKLTIKTVKKSLLWGIITLFTFFQLMPSVNANGSIQPTTLDLINPTRSGASLEELLQDLPEGADSSDPYLILVNALYPLSSDLWMDFAYTDNGQAYDASISGVFNQMLYDASMQGITFQVVSGYRTIAQQANNRQVRINSYLNEGLSEAEALYWTDLYFAPANATEHSTGLAIDLLGYEWVNIGGGLSEGYAYQPSAIWLAENAHYYGFVLRYPAGKTHLTGYNYEPWHFRYVGHTHADYMFRHGLVLEEYILLLDTRAELDN